MNTRMLVPFLVLACMMPLGAQAATPSITILSPEGGDSLAVNSKSKLKVEWEAAGVEKGAKICLGLHLAAWMPKDGLWDPNNTSIPNTFGNCKTIKDGKGKWDQKSLDTYRSVHSSPDEYVLVATLIRETPVQKTGYDGKPYKTSDIRVLARDATEPFTLESLKDKKAGMVTVHEGDGTWEAGVMYEKDAKKECENIGFAAGTKPVRCEWKGKEIYSNTPKEGRKLVLFVLDGDSNQAVGQKTVSSARNARTYCNSFIKTYGSDISCEWGNTTIKESGGDIVISFEKKKKEKQEEEKPVTTKKVKPELSAQEKAAKEIASAEDEIAETLEESESAPDQAVGLAVLGIAMGLLDDAKRYYSQGDWAAAESRARQAEEQAWAAGAYFD